MLSLRPAPAGAEQINPPYDNNPNIIHWVFYRYNSRDPAIKMRALENFAGITDALGYANAVLVGDKREPLYCQPRNLAISVGQHIELLQRWVQKLRASDPTPAYQIKIENMPTAAAMLVALQEEFPCK